MRDADIEYMQQALALAERGRGHVSPNPMVGCVLVKNGVIVGSGYHQHYGGAHAEINALAVAKDAAHGATAYITLEPCAHHGKTPPCTTALINAGIKQVNIAILDPNPLVAGKGCQQLEAHGITVNMSTLASKARELNAIFFHYMQTQRPYVIAKWAMSLDGKTTTNDSDDRNITSASTQLAAHSVRQEVDAILIGANTAIHDNPSLTVRHQANIEKQPLRIILSSRTTLPLRLNTLNAKLPGKTLVVVTKQPNDEFVNHCLQHNVEILLTRENAQGLVDLPTLLTTLGNKGISSLLVEGGMTVLQQFFQENLVNKVCVYLAPIIIGNAKEKIHLHAQQWQTLDNDYHFTGVIEGKTYV